MENNQIQVNQEKMNQLPYKKKTYNFSEEYAVLLGVEEAILLDHFQWFISYNASLDQNFHEGRYWTYNTHSAFEKLYPFWTKKQIKRIIDSLESQGIILKGNFNKSPYDRTQWYAFKNQDQFLGSLKRENQDDKNPKSQEESSMCPNGQMGKTEWENGKSQMGTCINTSIYTSTYKDTSLKVSAETTGAVAPPPDKPGGNQSNEFSKEINETADQMIASLKAVKPTYKAPKSLRSIKVALKEMMVSDGRESALILKVLNWILHNDEFWRPKFFSINPAKTLMTRFDEFEERMNARPKKKERKFLPSSDDDKALAEIKEHMKRAII